MRSNYNPNLNTKQMMQDPNQLQNGFQQFQNGFAQMFGNMTPQQALQQAMLSMPQDMFDRAKSIANQISGKNY